MLLPVPCFSGGGADTLRDWVTGSRKPYPVPKATAASHMVAVERPKPSRSIEVMSSVPLMRPVKRLHRSNGEIWLLPENEDYDPIDGSDAVILGRVTAVVRQY